ncbi:MAG: RagB/SusD family nutrient uptake outer membrane protein [Bacteroidales bacterium]|nr:RagB/SusD family nutrient uptake outer membrane protein [Bacteroidales bacterium]
MKHNTLTIIATAAALLCTGACSDFLDFAPSEGVSEEAAYGNPEAMVTAAYASLGNDWYTCPINLWPYGSLSSDDALKGGNGISDTEYHAIETWSTLSPSTPGGYLNELWCALYAGVSRCNKALISLSDHGEEELGAELAKTREAEVRFLRGLFYFKLIQVWYKVPYIDENTTSESQEHTVTNDIEYDALMGKVIEDFEFAYGNLPDRQDDKGRANKAAAAAMLAKCYLTIAYGDGYETTTGYGHVNVEYMQRVVEYTRFVKDCGNYNYEDDFGDIFMEDSRNGRESIFAIQHSNNTQDNTLYGRSNWSNVLNGCYGVWSRGMDFHKPSQNLVNAFKTTDGLPMFDNCEAEHNTYPVLGAPTSQKWDPRLFHTVGLPTFPYKYEAAYMLSSEENSMSPSVYGCYTSLKEVPQRSKGETVSEDNWQCFAMNDYVIRYTEVMLWRAEALIELNQFNEALQIINDIRVRARNSIAKHISYAADQCAIASYPDNIQSRDDARKYLRWETRLETAMESERFFNLRRWGLASKTLNSYFDAEQHSCYGEVDYAGYYSEAFFSAGKNEYWPIPAEQMRTGLYQQNRGY